MNLAGWTLAELLPLFAAGATAITGLYLLRMRRRQLVVPFAALWRQVTRESDAQGVSTVAAGLTKLVVPVDRNSPEVEKIKNTIAESAQYKARFQGLMDSLDKLGIQKAQLMEGVERAQHTLAESCATISKSLLQSAAIGRQMQTMGNALDLEVKLYARALRQRSEERLRKSLYHVVKSYEYHTLSRVPSDFFQTKMIEKIKQLEEAKLAAGQMNSILTDSESTQKMFP